MTSAFTLSNPANADPFSSERRPGTSPTIRAMGRMVLEQTAKGPHTSGWTDGAEQDGGFSSPADEGGYVDPSSGAEIGAAEAADLARATLKQAYSEGEPSYNDPNQASSTAESIVPDQGSAGQEPVIADAAADFLTVKH